MEFGKSFTYVFEDDDWIVKILLAAVIAFIPIIGPLAVAGWGVEITKRAIRKDPEQLPDWGDFVNYLIKGLVVILIGFDNSKGWRGVFLCGTEVALKKVEVR